MTVKNKNNNEDNEDNEDEDNEDNVFNEDNVNIILSFNLSNLRIQKCNQPSPCQMAI